MFFWNSCFFNGPADVGNLISGSSAFSKTILNIWNFTDHVLLKPGLENFEHYFASMWEDCSYAVVWAFFGIAFLCDWNENRPFPFQDGRVEGHVLIFSCENSRITTLCCTSINRRMLDPTIKKVPYVQGQSRRPSKMAGRAKSCLESNPIPARDAWRAQTNLVHTRTQRPHWDWARTVFECLLPRYRSAVDCCRGRGSGCSRPGYGINPLGGGHH